MASSTRKSKKTSVNAENISTDEAAMQAVGDVAAVTDEVPATGEKTVSEAVSEVAENTKAVKVVRRRRRPNEGASEEEASADVPQQLRGQRCFPGQKGTDDPHADHPLRHGKRVYA